LTDLESVTALARGLDKEFDRAGLEDEGRILNALVQLIELGAPRAVIHIHGERVPYETACAYLCSLSTHPTAWPQLEVGHLDPQDWRRRLTSFADIVASYARERGLSVERRPSRAPTRP
jgi:hypothetical protein